MSDTKQGAIGLERVAKVAVIGGGSMGRGCAQVFAAAGYPVALQSRKEETLTKAMETIRHDLGFLADRGVGEKAEIEATIGRIHPTQSLEEALDRAGFVLECVYEDMSLKQDLFKKMGAMTGPDTVLATNTSVMSITEIASMSTARDRIVGTHWWNPPTLLPLVEVVRTEELAEWVIELTMELMRKISKYPVLVRKDVPGFVANRLQHALWREAVSIVERGIADAKTVDDSIKYSFGMRLPVLAPLETADSGGLDLMLAIHRYVFPFLEDSHKPSPLLEEKVAKGELGFKTGGKGFREWTPEEMKALREGLLDYLARAVAAAKRPQDAGPSGAD
ncbi:MAG TPA: 3-hydroxyacyl-CoA dehydrogenase NAD-binding domain-containing protein [Thermoleophilia bacterium]|nr:3-hydroxyacyl-CoA dehydrogenase NAD-binding domain-containing protein [Thermoleophilia bacterium]